MNPLLRTAAALVISSVVASPALSQESACAKWNGVWEYMLEGQVGMFIISNDYAIGMYTGQQRSRLSEQPTVQERADAFASMFAEAWKIRCEGSRIYFDVLHSANPNRVGANLISEVTLTGNEANWRLVTPDGTQTGSGRGRRIQP